jgi:hypothetical protein
VLLQQLPLIQSLAVDGGKMEKLWRGPIVSVKYFEIR